MNAAVEDQLCAECLDAILSESARDEVREAAREARERVVEGEHRCAYCTRYAVRFSWHFVPPTCVWHGLAAEEIDAALEEQRQHWRRRAAIAAAEAAADQRTNDTEAA